MSWNTGVQRYVLKDANGNPEDVGRNYENTTTNPDAANVYKNEAGQSRIATQGTRRESGQEMPEKNAPVEIDGNTYHWFDVQFDINNETGFADVGSDIPAAGDKVVQFGNTTDPDRMNIIMQEVNGSCNPDAPAIKMYRGVYSFNMDNCWWGGSTTQISPSTGVRMFAPMFEWITEYGIAKQVFTRQEVYWTSIAFERDDYTNTTPIANYPDYSDDILNDDGTFKSRANGKPKNWVRKCRYYEQVTHNGSVWLSTFVEGYYWRNRDGNAVPNRVDGASRERTYTIQEPAKNSAHWTEQVEKGDPGAFKSSAFCRTNTDISNVVPQGGTIDSPIPTSTDGGTTWSDDIPDGTAKLWMTTAWFYSDGTHSDWTAPRQQTDTETLDIEFSFNSTKPNDPTGTAANKDTAATKTARHNQGWYDPNDTLPSPFLWSDMVWRAERKIKNGEYYGSWAISQVKGENSVRIDLTNENDSMLYSSGSTTPVSGNVVSVATLWDGSTNVSQSSTSTSYTTVWTISANGCTLQDGSTYDNIVVTGMTANTGYVNVSAVYTDKNGRQYTKSTRLTLKKLVDVDKYDLVITPNSIAYNKSTDRPATTTLSIEVFKSSVDGSRVLSAPPSGYNVYVNGTAKSASSTGRYSFTTDNSTYDEVQVKIAKSSSSTDILDAETIPIVKGENSIRIDLDNQADIVSLDSNGNVRFERTIVVHAKIFNGGSVANSGVTHSMSASSYVIGGCTPTISAVDSNGVVTLTWAFTKGMAASAASKTIYLTYGGVTYSADFALGTTNADAIWQVMPTPSEVSFSLNSTNNTYTPSSITLKCGYTKATGSGTDSVSEATVSSGQIGTTGMYLYYRKKTSGSWGSWTTYTTSGISVSSSTTVTDYEFILTQGSGQTTIIDRETIPVVKDGINGDGITGITRTYQISASGEPSSSGYPSDITSWANTSPSVTEDKPYLWVKMVTTFKYATATTEYYCSGKMGENGIDAKDAEWVYVLTTEHVAPTIVDESGEGYKSDDYLPLAKVTSGKIKGVTEANANTNVRCTDDPQGVNDTWQYEWEIKRTKGGADANGHRVWNKYSGTMTLHNNISQSSSVIDIDNDNDQFGTDSESVVLVQQAISTGVSMYYGTLPQTLTAMSATLYYDDGAATPNAVPNGVAKITTCNYSTGIVTVTFYQGQFPVDKTGVYALISAKCDKLGTKSIRFTISKLMGGAPGENPTIYQLDLSQKSLTYGRNADNSLSAKSNSVAVRVKKTYYDETYGEYRSSIISSAMTSPAITYKWGYDDSSTSQATGQAIGTSVTLDADNVGSHKKIWIQLESALTSDKEYIPITVDGENGSSPWIADLDNEMDSVACDKDGHPTSTDPLQTNLSMFYGSGKENFRITSITRNGGTSGSFGTGVTVKVDNTAYSGSTTSAQSCGISDLCIYGNY